MDTEVLGKTFVASAVTVIKKAMKKGYKLRTIDDLLKLAYPNTYKKRVLAKADDPILSTDSGIHNEVYGRMVWENLNMEANVFGALPKEPWLRSGIRLKSARGVHVGSVAEGGNLPDADHPDIVLGKMSPKYVIHQYRVSELEQLLSTLTNDDDIGDPKAWARYETAIEHKKDWNEFLTANVSTAPGGASGINPETIDRAISSTSEITDKGLTAGYEDFENIDRSANSFFNSYVDYDSTGNRSLAKDMIRALLRNVQPYLTPFGPKFWLTGLDTKDEIAKLYESSVRFKADDVKVLPSVNGIQVVSKGSEVGFSVATLYGYPIIHSQDVVKDGISRLYFIDGGSLYLSILSPTQVVESGVSAGNPWAKNAMVDAGVIWTIGNLRMRVAKACGKITDLA